MPEFAQHVVVTLAALSAAGIILRRVFGALAPGSSRSTSPCDSCPSAAQHRKAPPAPVDAVKPAAQPMVLVRRGTRDA